VGCACASPPPGRRHPAPSGRAPSARSERHEVVLDGSEGGRVHTRSSARAGRVPTLRAGPPAGGPGEAGERWAVPAHPRHPAGDTRHRPEGHHRHGRSDTRWSWMDRRVAGCILGPSARAGQVPTLRVGPPAGGPGEAGERWAVPAHPRHPVEDAARTLGRTRGPRAARTKSAADFAPENLRFPSRFPHRKTPLPRRLSR